MKFYHVIVLALTLSTVACNPGEPQTTVDSTNPKGIQISPSESQASSASSPVPPVPTPTPTVASSVSSRPSASPSVIPSVSPTPSIASTITPTIAPTSSGGGDSITALGMQFVYIQPGTFTMGDANGELDEGPHQVTLTSGFSIQTTEVTQGQWKAVMGSNPSKFTGDDNLPVEQVSWNDVQDFIQKLNGSTTLRNPKVIYRLPTEAEWEYAARAGTTTAYACGDSESCVG